ncbi:MAG: amidohydrolase family protein, partial [Nitrospirales bacterium]|nr:amidohydrolase family protein [Nitrospirales bacterium]
MAALSVSARAADIPTEVTLFKNVNVFDGKSDKLLEGHDVLVVRNMIEKVAKDIPSSGSYTLDTKTGGLRRLETPPSSDYHASNVVMVYEEEKTVKKEVQVNVIDGGGRTLMPGMIEAHGHVTYASPLLAMMLQQDPNEQAIRSARRAHDYLMAGFTTVRDMGGNAFGVRKALDADVFPGPRIYPSGPSISQ